MEAMKNPPKFTPNPIDLLDDARARLIGVKYIFDEITNLDYRNDLPQRQALELVLELAINDCLDKLTAFRKGE